MEVELSVPTNLRCPISLELMKDPVTLCTGHTYDRQSIETWLDAGNNVCPVTNQIIQTHDTIPNHTLRRFIQDWCVANSARGVERIPTPKDPLSPAQLNAILEEVSAGQKESIRKLRGLAKERDRNKKCIASSDASSVLASLFAEQSSQALNRSQQSAEICEEALGVLSMILPMTSHARESLALSDAIDCLVRILQESQPEAQTNAVVILEDMVSKNMVRDMMGERNGLIKGVVQLVREPICPAATKASLATIYHIALSKRYRVKLVEAGAVALLVEMLVETDNRAISERALLALDILCNCTDGRSAASAHALTVPVLVKKILRLSDSANELAVSILWNIVYNSSDGGPVLEALDVGAFHKLLLLLQVKCGERSRDKVIRLLKLFNSYTHDWECADTLHLFNVKPK